MASNFKQAGDVLTVAAPYTRTSGQGAMIGDIFGVALADVTSGDTGDFATEGVFELDKTSAQAWTVGQRVYWNASTKKADSDATAGQLIGVATVVAADPSSTGFVRLNGTAAGNDEGAQAAIADVATADADATYGSPEATLINELKTKVNTLLAELRIAGIIASS